MKPRVSKQEPSRADTAPVPIYIRADGVELEPAHVLDEAEEPPRCQRLGARPRQVLALEEERGHRARRHDGARARGRNGFGGWGRARGHGQDTVAPIWR